MKNRIDYSFMLFIGITIIYTIALFILPENYYWNQPSNSKSWFRDKEEATLFVVILWTLIGFSRLLDE